VHENPTWGEERGDLRSEALGINKKGQIVGLSRGGPFVFRAFLWQSGKLTDMNSLTVPGSPFLLFAGDIDQQGLIVGEALDLTTGDAPGFTATPVPSGATGSAAAAPASPQRNLPESVRRQIERRVGLGSELIP